jgi:hypothetical protein
MSRDFRDLFAAFNAEGVKYLVVGAHAYGYHHVPRFTKDMDVWVETTRENAAKVIKALLMFGAPKSHVSAADFAQPGDFLQIGVAPVRIDILTDIQPLSFAEAWPRRAEGVFMDQPVSYLGLQDLIAAKRHANRPQDRLDVRHLEAKLRKNEKSKPTARRNK